MCHTSHVHIFCSNAFNYIFLLTKLQSKHSNKNMDTYVRTLVIINAYGNHFVEFSERNFAVEAECLLADLFTQGPGVALLQHHLVPEDVLRSLNVEFGHSFAEVHQFGVQIVHQNLQQENPMSNLNLSKFNTFKYGILYTRLSQGLLYHRTCKRDFLCSWPSLNSYLK